MKLRRRLKKWALSLGALFLLGGCVTTATLSDLNYPLIDIQKAVGTVVPAGIASISSNQREYFSNFFNPEESFAGWTSQPQKSTHRAKAKISIMGDRRPYRIEVSVELEKRENENAIPKGRRGDLSLGEFEDLGSSSELSHRVAGLIRDYLFRRGQNKNVIDDFRPF